MNKFWNGFVSGCLASTVLITLSMVFAQLPKMEHACVIGTMTLINADSSDRTKRVLALPLECGDLKIEPPPQITDAKEVLRFKDRQGPLTCRFVAGSFPRCRETEAQEPPP